MSAALLRNLARSLRQGRYIQHQVAAIHVRRDANRIAAALLADRGHVNCRSAVAANDVLSVLAVAFRAADAAGIQRPAVTVPPLDDEEAQPLPSDLQREKMQTGIRNFPQPNAHFVAD